MILATATQSDIDTAGISCRTCVASKLIERVTGERVITAGFDVFWTMDSRGIEHKYKCGHQIMEITNDFTVHGLKQPSLGKLVSIVEEPVI